MLFATQRPAAVGCSITTEAASSFFPITLPTKHWTLTFYITSGGTWKWTICPQNPNSCAVRCWMSDGDILGTTEGTTLTSDHLKHKANRVRMAEHWCCVVLGDTLQISELKALLVTEWSSAVYRFDHKARKTSGHLEKTCCLGKVCETVSLAQSVWNSTSTQDRRLFSLQTSTTTNSLPWQAWWKSFVIISASKKAFWVQN